MTLKILVCDDEPSFTSDCAERIEAALEGVQSSEVVKSDKDDIKNIAGILYGRQKALRKNEPIQSETCLLDEADILVIDYDLVDLDAGARTTGEELAVLARVFSQVSYIVVLNQHPERHFDLTMRGNLESWADINLAFDHIGSDRLWKGTRSDAFSPWHWPHLPTAVENQKRRVAEIKEQLDTPIYSFFGFGESDISELKSSTVAFLTNAKSPAEVTFRDFVLSSGNGLSQKDGEHAEAYDEIIARVAAARLHKWIERRVLAEQNVLSDLPHILLRYPFLANASSQEQILDVWNKRILDAHASNGEEMLSDFIFEKPHWVSRTAFWGLRIDEDEALSDELMAFDFGLVSNVVFQEDTSRFAAEDQSREFVNDLQTPFDRRYVADVEGKTYAPQVRFSM